MDKSPTSDKQTVCHQPNTIITEAKQPNLPSKQKTLKPARQTRKETDTPSEQTNLKEAHQPTKHLDNRPPNHAINPT